MTERKEKFSEALKLLIEEGEKLENALNFACHGEEFEKAVRKHFGNDEAKTQELLDDLPDFKKSYQKWYSESLAVIKQVLPDRLSDFTSYFEYPRARKDITFQNYMIKDYLQGLRITSGGGYNVIVDGSAAIPEFQQQLSILRAAKDALESKLMDLTGIIQADLFDTEIETAAALAKSGYLRAAGAICGVVVEKHLRHVCDTHNLKLKKKNPGISDLLQQLRASDTITLAQERFVQSLADTRNLCSHAKGREPKKEEISELVEGTQKVLKTIY